MSPPSGSTLLPLVQKLQLWTRLDQADRDALIALPYTQRSLKAGQYIVWEGDRPQHACLLLAGFFEDQMRRRHSIRWYAEIGAGFYRRDSPQFAEGKAGSLPSAGPLSECAVGPEVADLFPEQASQDCGNQRCQYDDQVIAVHPR